jgi:hypothetical protein
MTSNSLGDAPGTGHPRDTYSDAARRYETELRALRAEARKVEAGRMGTFLFGAIVGLLRGDLPVPVWMTTTVSLVSLAIFLGLVVRHRRLRGVIRRAEVAEALARIGLARLDRDWQRLSDLLVTVGYADPLMQDAAVDESHPYAADLDVFGPTSVRALLGPTPTPDGLMTLEQWLSAPADKDRVLSRQAAVRALASDFEGRERVTIEALLVARVDPASWKKFLGWLEGPTLFRSSDDASPRLSPWVVPFAYMAPVVTLSLAIAWFFGLVPVGAWVLPFTVQFGLAFRWGRALTDYFGDASGPSPSLRRYHALFTAWEEYESEEITVRSLREKLRSDAGVPASSEIRTLERWLDAADSRASMFHVVFASAFFWDIHVASGMERWRARAGTHVREWFAALGELEALAALATLAHDHPDWCWPELVDGSPRLEAEGLGHPLLPESVVRTSDVALDPPGQFLLVTGSNMSGKSTLLRSIGLAAVLGQAGSVVCARRATLTPLRAFTSMRIHDSLTGGVSLFMAELLRLKALVDEVRPADEPALLYLIDEVLQGTNSEERRVAARRIVGHLLEEHAIGAVTTHDLALHEDPRLDPASRKVHFRETVGEEGDRILTFDYLLRPGLATSRNALKLLRIVGLDEGDDGTTLAS